MSEWLTTVEELDALPVGTIIRTDDELDRIRVAIKRPVGLWVAAFDVNDLPSEELLSRGFWQVIWSPPITKVEVEGVVRDFGCHGVVRPYMDRRELDSGPWFELAPLVNKRVRVTVEAIGEME